MKILVLSPDPKKAFQNAVEDCNKAKMLIYVSDLTIAHDNGTTIDYRLYSRPHHSEKFRGLRYDVVMCGDDLDYHIRRTADRTRDLLRANLALIKMTVLQ